MVFLTEPLEHGACIEISRPFFPFLKELNEAHLKCGKVVLTLTIANLALVQELILDYLS